MRKMFLSGLAAIAGAMFATVGIADGVGVDVLQMDGGIHVMSLMSDGADLLVIADVVAVVDVVPVVVASVMQPMEASGGAFTLMVKEPDPIVWSSGVTAFAVPPDLLI